MTTFSFTMLEGSVKIGLGKAGEIEVNLAKLAESAAVARYIFNYGLKQMLNDVHASEKDATAKLGLSQKKLDSLYAGHVAQARVSSSGDRLGKEMRRIAVEVLKDAAARAGTSWGKFSKEKQQLVIDKYLKAHDAKLRAQAEANLAAVKSVDDFDLDSLLS